MTKSTNYKTLFLVTFIFWTFLVLFETYIETKEFKDHVLFTANQRVLALTEKDMSILKWAASYRGVYVPVQETGDSTSTGPADDRDNLRACDNKGKCIELRLKDPFNITREIYEISSHRAATARIASLSPLSVATKPDHWEAEALKRLKAGQHSVEEMMEKDGVHLIHYMIPLVAKPACMGCHWEQGLKAGEMLGALHITFPMDNIIRDFNAHRNHIFIVHFLVWFGGLTMLALVYRAMREVCLEKEAAREEIAKREHFLRTLINAIPDPVCYKDREGRWLETNRKNLELFQLEDIDYYGKRDSELAELTHPVLKECMQGCEKSDRMTLENGTISRFDEMLTMPDGTIKIFDVMKVPIHDSSGARTGILVVARDITSRKQLEAQLQQSQKMEAVGVLAGGVAHDLNNIIQTIMGAAGLAIMKLDPSHPAYRYVNQIDESCERAAAIIRQLLIFSRRHEFSPELLNINSVTSDIMKMLRRLIGEDINVETDFDPDIRMIMADRGSIEQIIMNIVVNARDAMPDGGTITIKTENYTANAQDMEHHPDIKEGEYCCLSISDTGTGISEDIITRIFDPFFTTKGVGKGTGLGLSTVYGIVSKHRGWIDLESQVGVGTTFRIYLPVARPDDNDEKSGMDQAGEPKDKLRGRGERILVVEDDEDIRRVVTEMLSSIGYSATAVATGEDALRLIEQGGEKFDVMLVDMVLPGMKGLDLVRMISHRNDLPGVILNSGYTDERADISNLHDEYIRFIAKPYEFKELLKLIRDVLDEKKI